MFGCMRHCTTQSPPRKQRVQLQLMELEGVTLSNGVLFAKVRLLGGGRFCQYSERKEIRDNKVAWSDQGPMEFACRPPAALRVSVRKEERGGRSHSKLGWAVVDLAEALGGSGAEHSCILSPYNQRQRLDNSTLRLCVRRTAEAAQAAANAASPASVPADTPATPAGEEGVVEPAAASSATSQQAGPAAVRYHHRRNPSAFSIGSTRSHHSRANSLAEQDCGPIATNPSQSSSAPSFDLSSFSLERRRVAPTPTRQLSSRIADTRTDNFAIVRDVLEKLGIRPDPTAG